MLQPFLIQYYSTFSRLALRLASAFKLSSLGDRGIYSSTVIIVFPHLIYFLPLYRTTAVYKPFRLLFQFFPPYFGSNTEDYLPLLGYRGLQNTTIEYLIYYYAVPCLDLIWVSFTSRLDRALNFLRMHQLGPRVISIFIFWYHIKAMFGPY